MYIDRISTRGDTVSQFLRGLARLHMPVYMYVQRSVIAKVCLHLVLIVRPVQVLDCR